MPDPYASAEIASRLEKYLSEFVVDYQTRKSRLNLQFIQENYATAMANYKDLQAQYAHFADRNRALKSRQSRIELDNINNDYMLSFELFKSLGAELQQAKIKLNMNTPALTVIDPVRVPDKKSWPRKGILLALFTLSGGVFGTIYMAFSYVFVGPRQ